MEHYDAVIIGCGPAGGQCSRQLAKSGKKVLLVDKCKDLNVNAYSSGGAPLSILEDYELPVSLASSHWNQISVYSSRETHQVSASLPKGVVLDFAKLRHFLAGEVCHHGGLLRLDCSYVSHDSGPGPRTVVTLKDHASNVQDHISTDVLIDATGSERGVLCKHNYDKESAVGATGIEYHIEVDSSTFDRYANTLSFYLGHRWMPQGYAWIFPIKPNLLKIGIICYYIPHQIVPHDPVIRHYLDRMIAECIGSSSVPIHEKHGKTLYYTYRQRDLLYKDNVIAIGDAISTLNPFAAEGIRHAMASGNIASEHVLKYLNGKHSLAGYSKDLKRYFSYKWMLSEKIMKALYTENDDRKIDLMLKAFKQFSLQELLELGFDYDFKKIGRFFASYLWHRIKAKCR
jgi:flavin-dependent dehydrogenase